MLDLSRVRLVGLRKDVMMSIKTLPFTLIATRCEACHALEVRWGKAQKDKKATRLYCTACHKITVHADKIDDHVPSAYF